MITIYAANDILNRPVVFLEKKSYVIDSKKETPAEAYRVAQELVNCIALGIEHALLASDLKLVGPATVTIHKNGNSKISSIQYKDRHG